MEKEKKKRVFVYAENAEYQKEYQSKLNRILVSFNPKNAEDVKMWDFLQSKGKYKKIPYIKGLIKKDMGKND